MAMDKTPPRNRLIAFYAVLSVATLAMLKPGFDAYYDQMRADAVSDRLRNYNDLAGVDEAEARWNRQKSEGRLPLDRAVSTLAERGRMAFPQVSPESSDEMNLDPLRGWTHLPQEVPWRVRAAMAARAAEAADGGVPLDGAALPEGTTAEAPAEAAQPAPSAAQPQAPSAPRLRPAPSAAQPQAPSAAQPQAPSAAPRPSPGAGTDPNDTQGEP